MIEERGSYHSHVERQACPRLMSMLMGLWCMRPLHRNFSNVIPRERGCGELVVRQNTERYRLYSCRLSNGTSTVVACEIRHLP